jgi:hypothetical protein
MALNPLDEIRNLGAPEDLGGGLPMGGGLPDMGGGPSGMGGGMPIPSGPAMGGSMSVDPTVGAEALDFAMGDPAMGMPDMAMAAGGLGDPGLGGEASTDEAANQVANVIVEMAPSPDEAMNLASAIKEKVASIVMGEDMGAEGDRLVDLGLGAARGGLIPGMQFGGTVPPRPPGFPGTRPMPGAPMPPPQAFQRGTLPQQFGQPSWMGAQGAGGSGRMGPPVGGGYRHGGGIGSLMMQRGGEPTMRGLPPQEVARVVAQGRFSPEEVRRMGPQGRLPPQEVARVVAQGAFSPEEVRRMGPQGRGRPTGPPRRPPPGIRPGY